MRAVGCRGLGLVVGFDEFGFEACLVIRYSWFHLMAGLQEECRAMANGELLWLLKAQPEFHQVFDNCY